MLSTRTCTLVMLGLLIMGCSALVRKGRDRPFLNLVSSLFLKDKIPTLLGLLILIVLAGHVVWLAERSTARQETTFSRTYVPGLFAGMYWALVTASTIRYGDKVPHRWRGRLVAAIVIIISLPLFGFFIAQLSSDLTMQQLRTSIHGPEDLPGKRVAMGIQPDLAGRFLDHRNFSPRHDTILVESLARLQGGVRGREQFLEAALVADDEVDANYFTNMAQIMRGYHETVAPLTELQMVGRLAVAPAKNGKALLALPLDHLLWTPAADWRSQELKASYKAPGFTGQFDVWLTGTVSPLARQQLTKRGMTVTEEVYKRVETVD